MNLEFFIDNSWTKEHLNNKISLLKNLLQESNNTSIIFNFNNLLHIDSAGMILIIKYIKILEAKGSKVILKNIHDKHERMYNFYLKNYATQENNDSSTKGNYFYNIGASIFDYFTQMKHFLYFLGRVNFYLFYILMHPSKIRFKAIAYNIMVAGIKIIPIVAIAIFLIAFVLTYQTALQLEPFGADLMAIEMVMMAMFREFSPFVAAVIIAGRCASSFTAQIGAMKITEEIDAMRTMGLPPDIYLILPRVIALIITLPLMVFLADMFTLIGEMLLAKGFMNMSYEAFLQRVYVHIEVRHFALGILKAPLFGLIIAVIGCYRGLQVRGSTTSIGVLTTKAVVDSIFWIIIVNSIISYLSIALGF